MRIALDPYMHRRLPLGEVVRLAAKLGYQYIELSPREDFLPFYVHPRASDAAISELNTAVRETGVSIAAVLIGDYKWASDDDAERRAAVRYWRRAIEVTSQIGCSMMAAEFGGRPEAAQACEAAFWTSLEELLPSFEQNGITLTLEPHPYNFVESNRIAVDMVRSIGSKRVRYLYCAPHTFHMGDDMAEMIRYAAPVLEHVHVADTFNHRGSSGARIIVNPAGSNARVHQHFNIGEGEIDWDVFFRTLYEIGFDGLLTSSVFAWEERAMESSRLMHRCINDYLQRVRA